MTYNLYINICIIFYILYIIYIYINTFTSASLIAYHMWPFFVFYFEFVAIFSGSLFN